MKLRLLLLLPLFLGACAGAPSVTSWSNGGVVTPPPPTVIPGTYTTVAYNSFATGVTDPLSAHGDGGSVLVSTDPNTQAITKAIFISGDASPKIAAFSSTAVGTAQPDTIAVLDANFTSLLSNQANDLVAITPTPAAVGWSYQTFGVWANGAGPGTISAVSYGSSVTDVANIPKTGTATYNGFAAGMYLTTNLPLIGSNMNYLTSNVTAQVNFSTRTIAFSTSNSAYSTSVSNPYMTADSSLDMIGTLTIKPSANSFSGNVANTAVNVMSGTVTGKFYGPAAQEMGGVFSLKNTNGDAYVGAFGAKK